MAQTVKNLPAMWETPGLIPGSEIFPGGGNGNPLQYSCLQNPMDRGAWWATVHWVAKSWTQLSEFTFTFLILHAHSITALQINILIYLNFILNSELFIIYFYIKCSHY